MTQTERLLLNKVTIAGFRGYNEPKTISFEGKSAFLFAPNMVGKSSTLGAIEWCLFGDFYSLPRDRTKVGDELINDHAPRASVAVELLQGSKRITIERLKQRGESRSKLKLTMDDGTVVDNPDTPNKVFQVLGLGFDDFVRAVYLHQESLRDILTEDKKIRSEAMDRLFGLENLRNVSDGLRPAIARDALNSLSDKRSAIISLIGARMDEVKKAADQASNDAVKSGLSKRELELSRAKTLLIDAHKALKDSAEGTEVVLPKLPVVSEFPDIDSAAASLDSVISEIRKHVPEDRTLKDINRRLTDLDSAQGEFHKAHTQLLSAQKDAKAFVKKNGDNKPLEDAHNKLEKKLEYLNEQKDKTDAKGRLIQTGLDYLQGVTAISKCPLCEQSVKRENLLEHLQKEAKTAVSQELRSIQKSINAAKKEREEIKNLQEELGSLEEEEKETSEELNKRVANLSKILKKTLDIDDVDSEVKKETARLEKEKEKLEAPIRKRESTLSQVATSANQAKLIAEVLRRKDRLAVLSKIQEMPELKRIESVIQELAELQKNVELVNDATRQLQTELATSVISKSMNSIQRIYSELANHPYYDKIQIEVQPENRGGTIKNLYVIKGISETEESESLASLKFSTAHMNCVGLSVFLALAHDNAYSHKVGFLLLDDPSQNLDDKHMEALAQILAKLVGKWQLVIGTEDERFQEFLKASAEDKDMIQLQFTSWDIDGPAFKVTK